MMGKVFRFYYCTKCGKRYRVKPHECKGGGTAFRPGAWYMSFYDPGKRRTVDEKIKGATTLTEARKALRTRQAEVLHDRLGLAPRVSVTVEQFALGDYWNLYASRLRTAGDYKRKIEYRIIPFFGKAALDQVTRRDIEVWRGKLRDEGLTTASVNRYLALLKSIYRRAVDFGVVESNPTTEVKQWRENNKRERFLTPAEFVRLLDHCETQTLRAAITLAVGTMLRRRNLFALTWDQVDLDSGIITVNADTTKSQRVLHIPITAPVKKVLTRLSKLVKLGSMFVIAGSGGKQYHQALRTQWEKARVAAGMDDVRWHDLRHTGASWLAQAGAPIQVIQELLGHADITTTQRYAHLSPQYKRKEAEKIDRLFPQVD